MGQISNIVQGWKNYFNNELSILEFERAEVCSNCSYAIVGKFEKFMPDNQLKEIEGLKCKKCTCPLSAKIRSKN